MNKKRIAREWLLFLYMALIGFVAIPGMLTKGTDGQLSEFYLDLLDGNWRLWAFGFSPYALVLLGRSIYWAHRHANLS